MSMKHVAILGSTGSIGVNTLDVIRAHPDRFKVAALTAAKQVDLLAQQCSEFKPAIAVVADADGAARLSKLLLEKNIHTQVLYGPQVLSLNTSLPIKLISWILATGPSSTLKYTATWLRSIGVTVATTSAAYMPLPTY